VWCGKLVGGGCGGGGWLGLVGGEKGGGTARGLFSCLKWVNPVSWQLWTVIVLACLAPDGPWE